ncbi:unnamed protein product [Allacma fusca]|uniref:SEC14-like protein 2 n=1 Tax=Allacma fusca TaxID=39272 RepID=A0A8J2LNH8_9HEXA|nr:unnamed protein product [Allacma fusca]
MAAPSKEELTLIEKFRGQLEDLGLDDEQKSDMQLLRWIRARENDLAQAEKMFRNYFKWWKEEDIANILTWTPPEMILDIYPIHVDGSDNENAPVVIFPLGRADLKCIMRNGYKDETIRYIDQVWERAIIKMKGRLTNEGVPVTQFTCVMDMDQLSMTTVGSFKVIQLFTSTLHHLDSNYPEIFRKCFIINTSRAFQILFGIFKPLLTGRTFRKLDIFTTEDKWKPALLAEIPPSSLPEYYGAGDTVIIPMNVSNENCSLKWKIGVESYDIDFYVTLNNQEVVPKTKLESHRASVYDSHRCDSIGIYNFHFDNSYSRLRSKTVKYCIKIEH